MNERSLGEIHGSVPTAGVTPWKRMLAFAGPAYLVSVGYMDPGNWATDLEGGARFGYQLLWVLVLSNFMAILLQTLSARLGIVTRRDLAQACRDAYPVPVARTLWLLCEIAIAACDLAEILGAAIALQLLFKLPLLWGVLLTAVDTFFILYLLKLGVRKFESIIRWIVAAIGACFAIEIWLAKPVVSEVLSGLVPSISGESLYVAIGILGATVMPHNLYLHSALVQTREIDDSPEEKRRACKYNLIDSAVALNAALFVNVAILVLAAAVFYKSGTVVTEIQQAHELLEPLLGTTLAGLLFGIALLFAGQSSTLTGTLAGQVVMEGFLNLRMQPWLRRAVTRGVALVPAVVTLLIGGEGKVYQLLILSQVILSLQLPFAVLPLVRFTSDPTRMGEFVSSPLLKIAAWITTAIIVDLNLWLVSQQLSMWLATSTWAWAAVGIVGLLGLLLLYIALEPWLPQRTKVVRTEMPAETVLELEAPQYRTILVPLDHSSKDAAALRHAAALAKQHRAKLLLVHVEEGPTSRVYGPRSSTTEVHAGRRYLDRVVLSLKKQSIDTELFVFHSNRASDEIVRVAKEMHPDLIVMASHGHGKIADLVYGETIERVRHAVPVALLVVR